MPYRHSLAILSGESTIVLQFGSLLFMTGIAVAVHHIHEWKGTTTTTNKIIFGWENIVQT